MKISYNWLKSFIELKEGPHEVAEVLTQTGLEVEHVDEIETIKGGLRDLVVGEVLECEKHPNADKLKLTKVDLGSGEPVQIVCGAPNVAQGQKVVVAPVNSTIHPLDGEPFQIKKAKIRGEVSFGMICAEDEIGLGSDHDGIIILPENVKTGTLVSDHFNVGTDHCIEIGLTPNRGDAISHFGVARDLKAYYGRETCFPTIDQGEFSGSAVMDIDIRDTDACPRYAGVILENIKVGESPDWLKNRLRSIGLSPINNVVDVTNFVMHEIGQPIHAFDLEQIHGGIAVRRANKGEKLTTLDDIERELDEQDLVIADHQGPLALAGVFGGINSGVSNETRSVFIESAYFDPGTIRRTAKRFALNTDASFRYERGTDPNLPVKAVRRIVQLLSEVCGAQVNSELYDHYPKAIGNFEFELDLNWLNTFCGTTFPRDKVISILNALDISTEGDSDTIQLSVPPYRPDVTRPVDVAEEVLRIFGYNEVKIPRRISITPANAVHFDKHKLRNRVADHLSSVGFLEIMNNSQTGEEKATESAVKILNPLSNEYAVMRTDLISGVVESLSYNWKRKIQDIRVFEFGSVYSKSGDSYKEDEQLIIAGTGKLRKENWYGTSEDFDYFYLSSMIDQLLDLSSMDRSAKENLVEFGRFSKKQLKPFDIESDVVYAVIDWKKWIRKASKSRFELKDVPKYPLVKRDISAVISSDTPFESIEKVVQKACGKYFKYLNCFDVFEDEKLGAGNKAYAFSVFMYDEEKTMNDKQIDKLFEKMLKALETELNAAIRR